jgi:RNA polymerase sigma factor (TIGR02999 family)
MNARARQHFWTSPVPFFRHKVPAISDVTQIIERVQKGDSQAAEELLPAVYDELRRLAAAKMAQQAPGQTLQATALVHEAWLKLAGGRNDNWRDRQHFFRAAAEAMRHILIDRARRRLRVRHGEGAAHVDVEEFEISAPAQEDILLELDGALDELAKISPERAELVKLRFFAGLNEAEIANVLNISERSVQRQWSYARAWLFARIESAKNL